MSAVYQPPRWAGPGRCWGLQRRHGRRCPSPGQSPEPWSRRHGGPGYLLRDWRRKPGLSLVSAGHGASKWNLALQTRRIIIEEIHWFPSYGVSETWRYISVEFTRIHPLKQRGRRLASESHNDEEPHQRRRQHTISPVMSHHGRRCWRALVTVWRSELEVK